MPKPKKQSAIDAAAEEIIEHLEGMCSIRCPPEDYKAALEKIQEHIKASIEAVKDDIRRLKRED